LVTAANLAAAKVFDPLAVIYNPHTVIVGSVNEWFNPHMFTAPAFGTLGTAGRGILRAPGVINWDFGLAKDTKLGFLGEDGSIQFRGDIFNVVNHPNFAPPNFQTQSFSPFPSGGAGVITATNGIDQREIQLSVTLKF
jgi:hypothetical protein